MIQVRKERIAGSEKALVMSFLLMVLIVASLLVTARPAAAASGSAQDWGWNFYGQLGDGTDTDSNTPVQVNNLGEVKSVAAGCYHSLTLKQDGTVWAWGHNGDGQLGDGSNTDSKTPVQVLQQDPVTGVSFPLTGIKAIAAGDDHGLALKEDGTVWAWGLNDDGQLGDGSYTDRSRAVKVKTASGGTLGGVKAIIAGAYHSLALKEDGTVRAWGHNDFGQLGNGTNTSRNTAVKVKTSGGRTLGGVKAISAGGFHSLALKNDSTLRSWGLNNDGQLGDGSYTDRSRAVKVKTASGGTFGGVKAISAGGSHSLAVKQ